MTVKTLNIKYKPQKLDDISFFIPKNMRNILDTLISIDDFFLLINGLFSDSGKTTTNLN